MRNGRRADILNVMEKLHKTAISATDIASQFWCEKQMELNCMHGSRITRQINVGRKMHEELEHEANVPLMLQPRSYADSMYKKLYSSMLAVESIRERGRAREIAVYGSISGYRLVGKIDQLDFRDGMAHITEDKTRSVDTLPSEQQLLTQKVQVMIYRRMFDDIIGGLYTGGNFNASYGISKMEVTPEFARQLEAEGVDQELRKIMKVSDRLFSGIKALGRVGDTLRIRYLNQQTGREMKLYDFQYDAKETDGYIGFAMKYWSGAREALPVPAEEKWKCSFCAFFKKECTTWS